MKRNQYPLSNWIDWNSYSWINEIKYNDIAELFGYWLHLECSKMSDKQKSKLLEILNKEYESKNIDKQRKTHSTIQKVYDKLIASDEFNAHQAYDRLGIMFNKSPESIRSYVTNRKKYGRLS